MKRFILLCVVSLVLVAIATFAFAQGGLPPGANRLPQPRIVSGNDVGFRIEGTDVNGKPIGALVVRVDGAWVEVGSSGGSRFLGSTR